MEDFHRGELPEGEVLGSGDIDVLTISEIADPGGKYSEIL
jgi:hypothetical protein